MTSAQTVCFCLGTWQLAILAAARASEAGPAHLCVYESAGSASLLAATGRLAHSIGRWSSVAVVDLPLSPPARSDQPLEQRIAALHRLHPPGIVDEVWLCKVAHFSEKVVLAAYPSARVVLYEDGLGLYRDVTFAEMDGSTGTWLVDDRTYRRDVERIAEARLFLAGALGVPTFLSARRHVAIEADKLRSVLRAMREAAHIGFAGLAADSVVVLEQNFARWRYMDSEAERQLYEGVTTDLVAGGFRPVVKPHPRGARLASSKIQELPLPPTMPVELLADELVDLPVAAATSTALVTLPLLGCQRVLSFADRMPPPLPDSTEARLVSRTATPFDHWLETIAERRT
ncbi:MAG: polysialyltransferase family glycosyltransferase [Acidimicrobiales bacterium]